MMQQPALTGKQLVRYGAHLPGVVAAIPIVTNRFQNYMKTDVTMDVTHTTKAIMVLLLCD